MKNYFDYAYDTAMEKIAAARTIVALPQGYMPESYRVEPEIEGELWKRLAQHLDETDGWKKSGAKRAMDPSKARMLGLYYHDPTLTYDKYPEGSPLREALKRRAEGK